jgi:hypothetical protein
MTTPSLTELFQAAIDARLTDLSVAIPGKVLAYDAAHQTVDVAPQVQRVIFTDDGEKTLEALPPVPAVPLAFPRGGGFHITFPMQVGDFVLIVFCDRSIDSWVASGDLADPGDLRAHHPSNAVAYPGVYPSTRALAATHAANLVLGKPGVEIHVTPAGVNVGAANATHPMVLGDMLKALFDGHIHPTGMGPSGPPSAGVPIPSSQILSTKHKLDV